MWQPKGVALSGALVLWNEFMGGRFALFQILLLEITDI